MAPSEQTVQIPDLGVEFVVLLRSDGDDTVGANGLDIGSHVQASTVRDLLAVADVHQFQFALCGCIDKYGGDDEWAEVIALPGFVDADALDRIMELPRGHHIPAPLEIVCNAR